jgi:hypothetical protein
MIGAALSAPGTARRTRQRRSRARPASASSDAARSAQGGRESDSTGDCAAAGRTTALTAGPGLFARTGGAAGSEVMDSRSKRGRSTAEAGRARRWGLARRGRCRLDDVFDSRARVGRTLRARDERAVSRTGAAAFRVARGRSGAGPLGAALGGAFTATGASTAGTATSGEAGWTTGSGAGAGEAAGAGADSRGGSSVSGST